MMLFITHDFQCYLEEVIQESMEGTKGIRIGEKRMDCIRFADAMVLLAENEKMLQEIGKSFARRQKVLKRNKNTDNNGKRRI